jgi:hypothetical protein
MSIAAYFNKLAIVSKHYKNILKSAQDTGFDDKVKEVVKRTIEELKSDPSMTGVYYASNVNLQRQNEYYYVSFLLNVDKSPQGQAKLESTSAARQQLVKARVAQAVRSILSGNVVVEFGEHPADEPGFFSKKYD